jgi:peroxiredoxin
MLKSKLFTVLGLTVALAAAAGFTAGDDKAATAKIGEKAPAFSLTGIDGKQVSLKDYAGKIVVLEWVNPGCPICKGAHVDGRIPGMIKELKDLGVVHLAINSTSTTSAEENAEALKKYGIEYTVLLDNDGTVGHAYGAKTTPHMYVIDTDGVLRYNGALDNGGPQGKAKEGETLVNYAVQAVKQIKAGETVSPTETKSYGCSVKYGKPAAAPKP